MVVLQLFCQATCAFICALIFVRDMAWNHFGLSYFLVTDVLCCCVVFTDHPQIIIFDHLVMECEKALVENSQQ